MKLTSKQSKTYNPHSVESLADLKHLPDDYHAVLAPSSMGRVLKCPASVQESLMAPVSGPSEAALRGTRLHEVTERALNFLLLHQNTIEEVERLVAKMEPLAKDVQQVMFCIDQVESLYEWLIKEEYTVFSVKLEAPGSLDSFGMAFIHGTADLVIKAQAPDDKITVFVRDWKYGFVEVYSHTDGIPNAQLHLYSIMQMGDADFLNMGVVQPAHNYAESITVTSYESMKWLSTFFEPVILEAMGDSARFNPGINQCRFCPAKLTCRERRNKMELLAMQLQDTSARLPNVVIEELVQTYLRIPELKKYITTIEKHLLTTALLDGGVPNLKAVNGRGQRAFKNVEEAENFMLGHGIDDAELYKSKLISPAQAEALNRKLKKDEAWKSIIDLKPGKPQLVLESDKREAVTPENEAKRAFHNHIEGD